jgi:tripartite-type tricarboxylate transporter receptor subunit TctC
MARDRARGAIGRRHRLRRLSMPGMAAFDIDLHRRRWLAAGAILGLPGLLQAQARFPERAITLLVPFAPGGIADLTARAVAEHMARTLGQPVVVENKPSAGSIVASQAVAAARPDGHTLLLMSNANAVSVACSRSCRTTR